MSLHDKLVKCDLAPNIIRALKSRRMCWAGHVARMGERERERDKKCIPNLDSETVNGRDHFGDVGISRRRNNIKIDLKTMVWGIDWIQIASDRQQWRDRVDTVMNLRVPWNWRSFLTS
jgi:hypothetical protein